MLKFTYAKCLAWKNYMLMNLIESETLDWRKLGVRSAGKAISRLQITILFNDNPF